MLAVSSPGVERTLTRPEHFEICAGEEVSVKLFAAVDGTKTFRGTLVGLENDEVVITVGEEEKRFARKAVAKCETVFEW
ncbi:MAG: hypothetical protein IJX93_09695 [Clostridia bacterium]|nr:hypothetical protein [Clostridia bacterium]